MIMNQCDGLQLNTAVQKALQLIYNCVKQFSCIEHVILYGSWAKGTAMDRSDIDLAFVGSNIDLDLIREVLDQLDTLYKIDVVDLNTCNNSRLIKEIEKDGITIYSKI